MVDNAHQQILDELNLEAYVQNVANVLTQD